MKAQSKSAHTQGEWNANLTNDSNPDLAIFCKGLQIATIEPLVNEKESKANAQRIVSCVNFFNNIPDAIIDLERDISHHVAFKETFMAMMKRTQVDFLKEILKQIEQK